MSNVQTIAISSQHRSNHADRSYESKQIDEIEQRLNLFSTPRMTLQLCTYPRHKLDLKCQLLMNTSVSNSRFVSHGTDQMISARCITSDNIEIETDMEQVHGNLLIDKQIQTEPSWNMMSYVRSEQKDNGDDLENNYSVHDDTNELNTRSCQEYARCTRLTCQRTIITQHGVDRIASDGEHLLYFSDTSNVLCYVSAVITDPSFMDMSITKESVCRWPHHPIIDLIYSSLSSQFICATRTGVYTCVIHFNNGDYTIDIQLKLAQNWSYVRLSTDKNHLWLWTDTSYSSQLRVYSPVTFSCLKNFDLYDYPCFFDNSTSFCIHDQRLVTIFQFQHSTTANDTHFHVTFCDSKDLRQLSTVPLGECDIDHEIRANHCGTFFIINGKRTLWIIDEHEHVEYVTLTRTGRALTIHKNDEILIANGTQQLQCIARALN
jgi:hypothetical protein